ncbi:uncharacterized protein LOC128724493 [Anopheles nili]|uniref:uncharacterized protein LOC128724493 n=1 Tax=Anopheles nili TaxID=185578 RepID=UPI00237B9CB9|nr:uncharacterized protein LOC128724493 [Anopheles nili]
MDVESDGSERWEDFFGSSTDIGPSVLGYLDSLANNFNEEAKQLVESSHNKPINPCPIATVHPLDRVAHVIKLQHDSSSAIEPSPIRHRSKGTVLRPTVPAPAPPVNRSNPVPDPSPERARKISDKFFNPVSPSVQRMVSHSVDDSDDPSDSSPLGQLPARGFLRNGTQSASFSAPSRRPVKQPTAALSPVLANNHHHHHHHHHQKLPLSKNITKLTYVSDEGTDHPVAASRTIRTIMAAGSPQGSAMDASVATPDDNGNFASPEKRSSSSTEELQDVTTLQRKIRLLTVELVNGPAVDEPSPLNPEHVNGGDASDESSLTLRRETTDEGGSMDDAFVENCEDLREHRNTVIEACNYQLNFSRTSSSSTYGSRRDDPAGPDDRRTPSKPNRDQASKPGKEALASVATPKLSLCIDSENTTTVTPSPSLDTTLSGGSPYSSKASLLIPPNTPVLSSRAVSASSICSYSSSTSSSGSEHHLPGGKRSAPESYQASVESLADHSEPEHVSVQRLDSLCEKVEGTVTSSMTMCERAVREIIDSESSYVKDLGQVIRGYLEDWKERACLKQAQLNVLFSNIQEIYDFNFILLNRLRGAKGDPVAISNCFVDLHADFSCYTTYCTSYPEAMSLLTTLLQATHTNSLLVSTQKMLKHTLPLDSYLLKPVQRILKYHLLLDNLRKHCSDPQVALAHELMKKVAHNIDQVKTKLDQARLVKELAEILDGWLGPDLSVLGDLLHEGRLTEHAKPRIVLLFQSMFVIAKPKEDKRLQFRSYIPCKNLMLVEHLPGEPTSFNVIPFDDPKGVLKLTARNREEKRLWTQQIKQVMMQQYSHMPERAKELVLQLGDEDERFTDKPYWKRPTNSSAVPEYLERRQQFRRSEMRMRSKKHQTKKDQPPVAVPTGPTVCQLHSHDAKSGRPIPRGAQHDHVAPFEDCKCEEVKRQLQDEMKHRTKASSPPGKTARSRSESRCGPANDEEDRLLKSLYERRKLSAPSKRASKVKESFAGIKAYNSTMIPKRISEMRKRQPKTPTSCSTFYTDLEVEDAVATVSPETPEAAEVVEAVVRDEKVASVGAEHESVQKEEDLEQVPAAASGGNASGGQLKDSEIISKLILDVKQFNKVLNKPVARKKSIEPSACGHRSSSAGSVLQASAEQKPALPSTEPPDEEEPRYDVLHPPDRDQTEPIYESLLRNVHVPYKYAPPSVARHSLPCGDGSGTGRSSSFSQHPAAGEDVPVTPPRRLLRPESDYVTLAYSELGLLEGIESGPERSLLGKPARDQHRTPRMLRNSDTNINYHRDTAPPAGHGEEFESGEEALGRVAAVDTASGGGGGVGAIGEPIASTFKQSFLERQGSLSIKTTAQKSLLQRFISVHANSGAMTPRTVGSEGNLLHPVQRKLSEPNGGPVASNGYIIYKQGSMDLGSRIAHIDYADPKSLFFQSAVVRSVTTSTSSSVMSVAVGPGEEKRTLSGQAERHSASLQRDSVLATSSSGESFCEDAAETGVSAPEGCPEDDDNAVAINGVDDDDDDNCCFYERDVEQCLEHDFRDSAVYSGDDNDRQRNASDGPVPVSVPQEGQQRGSNLGPPPPIPVKPAHLAGGKRPESVTAVVIPEPSIPPATNSRGWVLQQVRRFQ